MSGRWGKIRRTVMYIPNYLEVQRLQQEEEDSKADLQEHRLAPS